MSSSQPWVLRSARRTDASRVDGSIRGDVFDLASRRTDIHELPVTEAVQSRAHSLKELPLMAHLGHSDAAA